MISSTHQVFVGALRFSRDFRKKRAETRKRKKPTDISPVVTLPRKTLTTVVLVMLLVGAVSGGMLSYILSSVFHWNCY